MAELADWLTLCLTPGLGAAGCKRLIEHFGDPGRVLAASPNDLAQVAGLRKVATAAIGQNTAREAAVREISRAEAMGITILTWADAGYPAQLRDIHDPPLLLYVKGTTADLAGMGLAVVGARAATEYGQRVAADLAARLARHGCTIISGLALGIDAAAHHGALAAGGRTVAVLGCGLDVVYPEGNRQLFAQIPKAGALVSEYPFGTKPEAFRFPARNRIISGLAKGVIVVEAARQSGSLITAQLALDQGREVFAIPGRIDSFKSEGCHRLLQQGAKLVLTIDDIFEELHLGAATAAPVPPLEPAPELSTDEQRLLTALETYPRHIDDLIRTTGLPAHKVTELLLFLELKGMAETLPGSQYKRR